MTMSLQIHSFQLTATAKIQSWVHGQIPIDRTKSARPLELITVRWPLAISRLSPQGHLFAQRRVQMDIRILIIFAQETQLTSIPLCAQPVHFIIGTPRTESWASSSMERKSVSPLIRRQILFATRISLCRSRAISRVAKIQFKAAQPHRFRF